MFNTAAVVHVVVQIYMCLAPEGRSRGNVAVELEEYFFLLIIYRMGCRALQYHRRGVWCMDSNLDNGRGATAGGGRGNAKKKVTPPPHNRIPISIRKITKRASTF